MLAKPLLSLVENGWQRCPQLGQYFGVEQWAAMALGRKPAKAPERQGKTNVQTTARTSHRSSARLAADLRPT